MNSQVISELENSIQQLQTLQRLEEDSHLRHGDTNWDTCPVWIGFQTAIDVLSKTLEKIKGEDGNGTSNTTEKSIEKSE